MKCSWSVITSRQTRLMCRNSDLGLCCVATPTCTMPEFTQFDEEKSMLRYAPPNGMAGLQTWRVSAPRRVPLPPASTTATVSAARLLASIIYCWLQSRFKPSDLENVLRVYAARHSNFYVSGGIYSLYVAVTSRAPRRYSLVDRRESSSRRSLGASCKDVVERYPDQRDVPTIGIAFDEAQQEAA